MSMPDWPENNKPAINPATTASNQTQFSPFTIPQNAAGPAGNNSAANFNIQYAQQQQQSGQAQFQPNFSSPVINGLKRRRENADSLSPKSVASPRPRNVTPTQQAQQLQQMQGHSPFPSQQSLQAQQGNANFSPSQIRPQPPQGQQQIPQQFAANFANLPPHIQQRIAQQQQLAQHQHQQQQQLAQHQQQLQQPQSQTPAQPPPQQQPQQRSNPPQGSPSFAIQPAPNRFVQGQPNAQLQQQGGGQFDPNRNQFQLNPNQPLTNQMAQSIAQTPQLYQQRLLQQQAQQAQQAQQQQQQQALAAAQGSPLNAQTGLPQQFQNQPQHPNVSQLSAQATPEPLQRSPAMRNLQTPKSTGSPHLTPRSIPASTPQQHPMQLPSQQLPQTPQQVPQQLQPGQPRPPQQNKEGFLHSLYDFMNKRGTPITSTPHIASRQIDLFTLFTTVAKEGGLLAATNKGAWGRVAVQNQLPATDAAITSQLQDVYKNFLHPFEEALQKMQAVRRQQMGLNHVRPGVGQPGPPQPGQPQLQQPSQQQLQSQMAPGAPHPQLQQTPQQPAPILQNQQQPSPMPQPQQIHPMPIQQMQNGMSHPLQPMPQHTPSPSILANHLQRIPPQPQAPMQSVPGQGPHRPIFQQPPPPQNKVPIPSASPIRKSSIEGTPQPQSRTPSVVGRSVTSMPKKPSYQPKKRNVETHGGWHLSELMRFGHAVEQLRPSIPSFQDLGIVDVHALTMSLRSGLPGEVSNALDTLTVLLNDTRIILSLNDCWDMLDALLEVAEDDCQILEEGFRIKKRRVSCSTKGETKKTLLDFEHYHDLVQSCTGLSEDLDELVQEKEKHSIELRLSADRLLCVTAILRNLSFIEFNHEVLGGEDVIRFLTRLLRGLHSSQSRPFLVTKRNSLELVKDIIALLSNVAHCIRFKDLEAAQMIYSFILSFTPEDRTMLDPEALIFPTFKPSRDGYLPPALDTLAKLLVVDHPNKEYFVTLLRATTDKPEGSKFSRGDIFLTRAFGMAISVLPSNEPAQPFFAKEERMAVAEQGMMAATALVNMLPNDGELARYWLSSKDNFGARLVRTIFHLAACQDHRLPPGMPVNGGMYAAITRRGMKIIEVMTARAAKAVKDGDIAAIACSKKEQLLGAMLTSNMDGAIVESLWRLHDIEENIGKSGSSPRSADSPLTAR